MVSTVTLSKLCVFITWLIMYFIASMHFQLNLQNLLQLSNLIQKLPMLSIPNASLRIFYPNIVARHYIVHRQYHCITSWYLLPILPKKLKCQLLINVNLNGNLNWCPILRWTKCWLMRSRRALPTDTYVIGIYFLIGCYTVIIFTIYQVEV